jgi:hypothetical protein
MFLGHILQLHLVHPPKINGFVTIPLNIDTIENMKLTQQGSESPAGDTMSKKSHKQLPETAGNEK